MNKTLESMIFENQMRWEQGDRFFPQRQRIELLVAFAEKVKTADEKEIKRFADKIVSLFELYDNE